MKNNLKIILIMIISICVYLFAEDDLFKQRMKSSFDELKHDAIPVYIMDASDGKLINGVKMEIIEGEKPYLSNKEGKIFINLENGHYNLVFSKKGYIDLKAQLDVQAGTIFGNSNYFSMSKEMPLDFVRIVLEWGKDPADLDLHCLTDDGKHVSYRNRRVSKDKKIILDRDDRMSYGPETITLKKIDPKIGYKIYVHNYSKKDYKNADTFKDSEARISVYVKNTLHSIYKVKPGKGTFWKVLNISNNEIKEINSIK